MPGERWPDKRARAVFFAGANRLRKEGAPSDPDAVADTGLHIRDHLFVDPMVREDNADTKANRIGYSADCMQFATLEPVPEGIGLGLWLTPDSAARAKTDLGATADPNPFRRMYGWMRVVVPPGASYEPYEAYILEARRHAATTKKEQDTLAATKKKH